MLSVLYSLHKAMLLSVFVQLSELRKTLSSWEKEVASLRQDYPHLLFFSVQQIVQLQRLLLRHDWEQLVQVVGCLFKNSENARDILQKQMAVRWIVAH